MALSRDSMLALQRHFLGALSDPARTWLEPVTTPRLAFSGSAIRRTREGCLLDFGVVESPGVERQFLCVSNCGAEPVDLCISGQPEWLTARWRRGDGDVVHLDPGAPGAMLELQSVHDAESDFGGTIRFVVNGGTAVGLGVRLVARRMHPIAQFDFNGSPVPRPFEFTSADRAYELSVANKSRVPLVVSLADLPEWLRFEIDGRERGGPMPGRFFRRTAPFAVKLRPRVEVFGQHYGEMRIETNDPRPEWRNIELQFSARVQPVRPHVRVFGPPRTRLRAGRTATANARLENWGSTSARVASKSTSRALRVTARLVVPAACDGRPGTAILPIRIVPAQLAPGAYTLPLTLRVDGGDPAAVDAPVHVDVLAAAERRTSMRPEMIAVLMLLLLTLLFIFVVRGLP